MKTAEQILDQYFHHFRDEITRKHVIKAMEEYASQFKRENEIVSCKPSGEVPGISALLDEAISKSQKKK